ncbi:MAG: SpoIIE family protein phosphatase [Candidatus Zixiibacteriota bacterium]
MQLSDFRHFRDLLIERRQNLTDWLNSGAGLRDEEAAAVRQLMGQIKDALGRIESGSFGKCDICHDGIEPDRLEIQPIRRVCLECISEAEKAALEEDLFLASKIHRALLPQRIPAIPRFDLAVKSLAASDIGGDYYDFLEGPDGNTMRIVIADAMGHGLPAGLLMSNFQGALRVLSADIDSPAPLVTRLNQWICRNVPVTKFVSMVCLCLHKTSADETHITFANAGHPPPIVFRDGGSVELLEATGTVMGVHEDFRYDEGSLKLRAGDYLALYTDGITEAQNVSGEEFEQERIVEFFRDRAGRPFDGVVDDLLLNVLDFTGGRRNADDITAIILHRK